MSKAINITPKEIAKALYDLLDEIEELEDKYENAVADYEYEKCKNNQAIEYIKEHNVIAVNKEHLPTGIERCCSQELLEILGDKE